MPTIYSQPGSGRHQTILQYKNVVQNQCFHTLYGSLFIILLLKVYMSFTLGPFATQVEVLYISIVIVQEEDDTN